MHPWWTTFFDDDYLKLWGPLFTEAENAKQAAELWAMLDLSPGCRILDAPCGWGRLSRPLALLGATVLGVDQSEPLLASAAAARGDLPPERLRYLKHDLRTPLPENGFDVACNIFTSFGYGTEEEDVAIFRTLRNAVRPGGRVVVETNHRGGCRTAPSSSTNPSSTPSPASSSFTGTGPAPMARAKSTPSGAATRPPRSSLCWSTRACNSLAPTRGSPRLHTKQRGPRPAAG